MRNLDAVTHDIAQQTTAGPARAMDCASFEQTVCTSDGQIMNPAVDTVTMRKAKETTNKHTPQSPKTSP